jgi:hypothetical protein
MKLPANLKLDQVVNAAENQLFDLSNPGFCLACGEEVDYCEPDAREYHCELCGERKVYGAMEILMMFA